MAGVFKIRKISPAILLIPLVLLIAVKYVAVELSDTYYVTSYGDARSHFKRGFYVSVTGHSEPYIDKYFDLQPAFFWVTGIILNVVVGTPTSLVDPPCITIVKWFHLFAIATYIPILYIFYKRSLGSPFLIAVALLLQFSFDFSHFHYSAEQYGLPLYWLILFMLFSLVKKHNRACLTVILVAGFSLIFLHQGLVILTLLALLALVFYQAPFKILTGKGKFSRMEFFMPLITLSVAWFSYLTFITIYTFKDFVTTFRKIVETIYAKGVELIPSGLVRADPIWEQVVFYKAIYMLVILLLGIILSFINAYRNRDEADKLAFSIMLLSTAVFGTLSIALGGVGYIERLPNLTLPITVYSLVKFISKLQSGRLNKGAKMLTASLLVVLMLSGYIFYLSGRNFQSVTYGEYYSYTFLSNKSPWSIANAYPGTKIGSLRDIIVAELKNESVTYTFIKIERHDVIQNSYYLCANVSLIESAIEKLQNEWVIIYSNSDSIILLKRGI